MTDDLEWILARVASGELTPESAEPLVAAVAAAAATPSTPRTAPASPHPPEPLGPLDPPQAPDPPAPPRPRTHLGPAPIAPPRRAVRVQVTDGGRSVVNLRIPMSLASLAGSVVPGLADPHLARLQQALRDGETGTILDIRDEDGSGVVIATE